MFLDVIFDSTGFGWEGLKFEEFDYFERVNGGFIIIYGDFCYFEKRMLLISGLGFD